MLEDRVQSIIKCNNEIDEKMLDFKWNIALSAFSLMTASGQMSHDVRTMLYLLTALCGSRCLGDMFEISELYDDKKEMIRLLTK